MTPGPRHPSRPSPDEFCLYGTDGSAVPLGTYQHQSYPFVIYTFPDVGGPTAYEHTHNFVEIVYVRRGSATHVHDGRSYPIYAGDCFVISHGEPHGYRDPDSLGITNILFTDDVFGDRLEELREVPGFAPFFALEPLFRRETGFRHKLHLSGVQQRAVVRMLDQLQKEYESELPGHLVASRGLFEHLVVYLSRVFAVSLDSGKRWSEFTGQARLVEAAIAYLEKHVGRRVRVGDVARSACVSTSTLAHVFKRETGMTLMDYMTRMRVDRACELLRNSPLRLAEIAFDLGFSDTAYFSRVFRKHTGASPSAYRRTHRPESAG